MENRNMGCGLIAIPIGIIIFFSAFFVIWTNEGRVDLSALAENSVPLTGDTHSPDNEGKLISVSGTIESAETLADPSYLKPQKVIHLVRTAQMYAWSESGDDEDGYDYHKVWTSSPADSDNFEWSSGHHNPPMAVQSQKFSAQKAAVGRYTILPSQIVFNQVESLSLTEGKVSGGRVSANYLYVGSAAPQNPQIGDIRLSYSGFKSNKFGTIFGKQQGTQIVTWDDGDGTLLYRAYPLDRAGGIAALRIEYLTALWGMRMLGLGMFFVGLMLIVSPLRQLLGYIPLLGKAGNSIIGIAAFAVAFIVWLITLTIAIIFHNIIGLILVLILVAGAGYYIWSKRDTEKSPEDLGMA